MIIGLAGDWHGNVRWACSAIELFGSHGVTVVEQLGDFGVWPGVRGLRYLDAVQGAARRAGVVVYVTPGNHEDYSQINALEPDDEGLLGWPERPNVRIRPRGMRWEMGGRSFVSLGGAPSIDLDMRTEGVSWWPEEMITLDEAEAVAAGGHADVMLAHDSLDGGTREVQHIVTGGSGFSWSDRGLAYAREGRKLMNVAVAGVRPRLFAHGHYHTWGSRQDDDDGTLYLSLDADGMAKNVALLDLGARDLRYAWFNVDGSLGRWSRD